MIPFVSGLGVTEWPDRDGIGFMPKAMRNNLKKYSYLRSVLHRTLSPCVQSRGRYTLLPESRPFYEARGHCNKLPRQPLYRYYIYSDSSSVSDLLEYPSGSVMRGPWRRIGIMRGRSPWNHGSTPQDWNEGKEWKDKWMGNPPMC